MPGLDFDLTGPVVGGVPNLTVSAQDDIDSPIRADCRPRSGSWFRVGRTRVRCAAADTGGNERTATFVVTAKRAR